MFGKFLSFVVGIYAGIYIDQHYKLPKVDDPKAIWSKIQEFSSQYKKDEPGPSKSD